MSDVDQGIGMSEGQPSERDLDQARVAIDSAAALVPSVEAVAPSQVAPVMDALSQLRLAYVKAGGEVSEPSEGAAGDRPVQEGAEGVASEGPAQQESRIWVPPGTR